MDCDIFGRFFIETGDTIKYEYYLEEIDKAALINSIKHNMDNTIAPVLSDGIYKCFELYPKAIYTAKRKLKDYLNIIN